LPAVVDSVDELFPGGALGGIGAPSFPLLELDDEHANTNEDARRRAAASVDAFRMEGSFGTNSADRC
jgi:hypothetical protein